MSVLSKSIKPLKDPSVPFDKSAFPYVVKAYFFIGDTACAQYFAVDNAKHVDYLHEVLVMIDFCVSFAVGTPDTIKLL